MNGERAVHSIPAGVARSISHFNFFFMWFGKNITLFNVIQWLIIGNISTAIYQTQSINTYIFWFAGLFSVTVLQTWLPEKTNIKLAR